MNSKPKLPSPNENLLTQMNLPSSGWESSCCRQVATAGSITTLQTGRAGSKIHEITWPNAIPLLSFYL